MFEKVYADVVEPRLTTVRKSQKKEHDYGHIQPCLMLEMISQTGLKPGSIFVDVGCGIGTFLAGASGYAGCQSWGIEFLHDRADIGKEYVMGCAAACREVGLSMGNVTITQGDMLDGANEELKRFVKQADVLLVNNLVFEEESESFNASIYWPSCLPPSQPTGLCGLSSKHLSMALTLFR